MTFVLGEAFDAFAVYQAAISSKESNLASANATLKNGMVRVTYKLILLGVLAGFFITVSLSIWLIHGERVAMRLRRVTFMGIVDKPLAWFDLGMGKRHVAGKEEGKVEDREENESSGGLAGRFAR